MTVAEAEALALEVGTRLHPHRNQGNYKGANDPKPSGVSSRSVCSRVQAVELVPPDRISQPDPVNEWREKGSLRDSELAHCDQAREGDWPVDCHAQQTLWTDSQPP